jgi:hypothetical protein
MSLIEDARAAKEAGLSYGQYMLQNKPFIRYHRDSGKRCVVCGGVLSGRQQRFCTDQCRNKHRYANTIGDKFV